MRTLIDQALHRYTHTDFISKLRARHILYLCVAGMVAVYSSVIAAASVFVGFVAYLVSIINRQTNAHEEARSAQPQRTEEIVQSQKMASASINKNLAMVGTGINRANHEFEEAKARLREVENELTASKESLRLAEEKFSKVFHFSPLLISLSTAAEERFVDVSDSFVQLSGHCRDELIGRTWHEFDLWSNVEESQRIKNLIATQRYARDEEIHWRSKHGEIYNVLFSAEVIEIFDVPHIMAFAMDITDRTQAQKEKVHLENQLLQAQKMESVGRLAGGLAHDFNNLLSIMLGYAEIGLEDPSIQALPIRNTLTQILKAGERVHNLTRQLLAFGRKQVLKREELNLNHIILDFQQMLVRLMGEDIEILTHLTQTPWSVLMDITQAEQILLNVAVNARDAMPQGGQLVIKTANVSTTEQAFVYGNLHPGDYVELTISDTGCGIDAAAIGCIFEPFFTTKERGKGTGLGLSTVYGIVKQHGGEIFAESKPGKGATFKIFLPRFTGVDNSGVIEMSDGFSQPIRHEAILVLEDEPAV